MNGGRWIIFFCSVLLSASGIVFAADPSEPPVTKIVSRIISDSIPADSFGAKPKTLYRAGYKYSRLEEELDAENGIHGLSIGNEPDNWMINLADKTGRHIVDPGPTFFIHVPIVLARNGQRGADEEFKDLEYGHEMEFFRGNSAKSVGTRLIDGKMCKALSIKKGDREVVLSLVPGADKPYQLEVMTNGKTDYSIRYLLYQRDLPFQKSLFEPPKGISITEANSVAQR